MGTNSEPFKINVPGGWIYIVAQRPVFVPDPERREEFFIDLVQSVLDGFGVKADIDKSMQSYTESD